MRAGARLQQPRHFLTPTGDGIQLQNYLICGLFEPRRLKRSNFHRGLWRCNVQKKSKGETETLQNKNQLKKEVGRFQGERPVSNLAATFSSAQAPPRLVLSLLRQADRG